MNFWDTKHDFGYYEFKPTFWQRIKLFFGPVNVSVDLGEGDNTVICTFQQIGGYVVCTKITPAQKEG